MREYGNVNIPQEEFIAKLRMGADAWHSQEDAVIGTYASTGGLDLL